MFARLLLLFTIVPLVELYILIRVGNWLGALPAILIVIGTGALGAWLARQQGLRIWWRIRDELARSRFPAEHMLDGFLVLVAGILLLTPGLLTDLLGLSFLFPPSRSLIKGWVRKKLDRMVQRGDVRITGFFE